MQIDYFEKVGEAKKTSMATSLIDAVCVRATVSVVSLLLLFFVRNSTFLRSWQLLMMSLRKVETIGDV